MVGQGWRRACDWFGGAGSVGVVVYRVTFFSKGVVRELNTSASLALAIPAKFWSGLAGEILADTVWLQVSILSPSLK